MIMRITPWFDGKWLAKSIYDIFVIWNREETLACLRDLIHLWVIFLYLIEFSVSSNVSLETNEKCLNLILGYEKFYLCAFIPHLSHYSLENVCFDWFGGLVSSPNMLSFSESFQRLQCLLSFTFQRLQCLLSFIFLETSMSSVCYISNTSISFVFYISKTSMSLVFYISKTLMSSVFYISKTSKSFVFYIFKDFNVFCLLHFQRLQCLLSFTFQRLQCLQSFTFQRLQCLQSFTFQRL